MSLTIAAAMSGLLGTGCGARSELLVPSDALPAGPCPEGTVQPSGSVLGPGSVLALAADRCGFAVVAGTATGTLAFDGVTIVPNGDNGGLADDPNPGAIFLAHLGPSPFGLAFAAAPPIAHPLVRTMDVAVDGAANVVLSAQVESPVDFGGGPLGATSGTSGVFARFDATGQHVFSHGLSAPGGVAIGRAAFDGEGNVFVAGAFFGALTLDDASALGSSGPDTIGDYVLKLDPAGKVLWSKTIDTSQGVDQLAVSEGQLLSYRVPIAAWPDGSVAFAGGQGGVTALDPSGSPHWHQSKLGGADLVVDGAGSLVLLGGNVATYVGADGTGLGHLVFPMQDSTIAVGDDGALLGVQYDGNGLPVTLQARTGQVILNRPLNAPPAAYALPAIGGARNAVLAGGFQGTFDPGTGPLTAQLAADGSAVDNVFVAVLAP